MDFRTPPPFPGENGALAEELNRHVPFVPDWDFSQKVAEGEADFRRGLFLRMEYPDPEGLLQTAETDFNRFLREAGLLKQDASAVVTAKADGLDGEAFRTTVLQNEIRIEAGNTEGIRRGLYELEDNLMDLDFLRISRSAIVNFRHIQSIRPELGGRLLLTMENGEQVYVSRQYAASIKEKLRELERSLTR